MRGLRPRLQAQSDSIVIMMIRIDLEQVGGLDGRFTAERAEQYVVTRGSLQRHFELFDQNPHTFGACLWCLHDVIRCHVDRVPLSLEELHFHQSKYSRQSNVQLRIAKIHAQTVTGAFAEADEIRRERLISTGSLGVVKPAVRYEGVAGRKYTFVMMLDIASQADGDARRNGVGAVFHGRLEYARGSLRGPVGESEC